MSRLLMLLTPEDIIKVTGYVQPAAQIRALKKMGIALKVRPDGKPVVTWSMFHSNKNQPVEPDFDSIRKSD